MTAAAAPAQSDHAENAVVTHLAIGALHESATNPRKAFDEAELSALADSIRAQGILQPLLCRPVKNGKGTIIQIIAGARRFRAAQRAGLERVPVIVREISDEQALEIQMIENLQRAGLHPLEEARGYHALLYGGTDYKHIAEKTGRTVPYVYGRVKLLGLTKEAQQLFLDGRIQLGHALLMAPLAPTIQEELIGEDYDSPLFVHEDTLFKPDDDTDEWDYTKAISVNELKAWIDKKVRLDTKQPDAMLFPEAAAALATAQDEALKVVHVTFDRQVDPHARGEQRTLTPNAWKRADGKQGSDTCLYAVVGLVVAGAGRGEAFKVCTAKKKCSVHWAEEQREAQREAKAVAKGATGEEREDLRRQQAATAKARRERENGLWEKGARVVAEALAAALKKCAAGASSAPGKLLLEEHRRDHSDGPNRSALIVGPGKTAEDLVRHLVHSSLMSGYGQEWGRDRFIKRSKALGVDVKAIVAAADEDEPKLAAAPKSKKVTAAKKGAKRKKGGR